MSTIREVRRRPRTVGVACSGGRDSVALLHATLRFARASDLRVVALHVNHGLMEHANAWEAALRRRCARWAAAGWPVTMRSQRLAGKPGRGDSVEAWARRGRYGALTDMARAEGVDLVLLAHHRRDQAETVLLQALRGAGAAGLASMPRSAVRDGINWARPWIEQPRDAIESYLARHRLSWAEDGSNADRSLARGRLRSEAWVALQREFPHAEAALATTARRAAAEAQVLDEIGAGDLASIAQHAGLDRALWLQLSIARRQLALRCWLARLGVMAGHDALVQRLCDEWPRVAHGLWPVAGLGSIAAYRGHLSLRLGRPSDGDIPEEHRDLSAPGRYRLEAWNGWLLVEHACDAGVPASLLRDVLVGPRPPAGKLQVRSGAPPRSLKKQHQSAGVPPHRRGGPVLSDGGQILFVAHLGPDARMLQTKGSDLRRLTWQPDPS